MPLILFFLVLLVDGIVGENLQQEVSMKEIEVNVYRDFLLDHRDRI